ncbi:MAG TPA: hypothetical protein VHH73_06425 [Verrucomicrobiae bacterium]|nr:hypothetical protein [Verrucomicrobiae bacterium]
MPESRLMFIPALISLLAAPLLGLLVGRNLRAKWAGVGPEQRNQNLQGYAFQAVIWLPFVLICLSGPIRLVFLATGGLLYFTIIATAKRAAA